MPQSLCVMIPLCAGTDNVVHMLPCEQQGSHALGAKLHAQFNMPVYVTKKVACRLAKEKYCVSEMY